MIVKHPSKRDWFRLDPEDAKPIYENEIPGLKIEGARFIAHRNLLTLLDDPLARKLLERPPSSSNMWARRDEVAAELGFKYRTTQQQALDFIAPRRGTLVGDDMRLGKAHRIGTKLLGPRGWFAIETVKPGDQVIGSDGCPYTITGVFPRGRMPVFRVTFSDGASVVVAADHLWAAWHHNDWHRGKNYRVMETSAFTKLRDGAGNMQWRIPLVKPIEFPQRALPLDPYLLGVLLGDGSLSQASITFCTGDEETPRHVEAVLPPGVELRACGSADHALSWRIKRTDPSKPNPVRTALTELGLCGTLSDTKFVPDLYLFAPITDRLALLQGLLDTDGEYCAGILAFSSASERLRDAVRFLVESLGGTARIGVREVPKYTHKGEQRTGKPSYRLTIAMPDGFSPFRARHDYVPREKFKPTRLIKSIEPEGEDEVICISVDAPDQLYVTEHCIVTHNTLTAVASHDPARGQLVVVAPLSTRGVWLGWMRRVFPGVPIGVFTGRTYDAEKARQPLVFAHYDIISSWQVIGRKIGTLVFDEAHLLGNPATKRSRAAALLSAWSEKVIALTGTPIWDLPPDLWSLLTMLCDGWGNRYDFCQRYGAPEPTAYGTVYTGLSNGAELKERLSEVMIRRRWIDVSEDVPPITRSVVIAEVSDKDRNKLDVLAGAIKSERTNTAANLAIYRQQVSLIKAKVVVDEARKVTGRGEPVVVWTWHKSTVDIIAKGLQAKDETVFVIHGDVAADKREQAMAEWKEHPNAVLIATMAVAQVGIDLSHARIAIFAEIDYTPAILGQAEMRTFSPTRGMDIIFVVANHLVDQRIVRALIAKLSAADPLGVGAAVDAIDALRDAVLGPQDEGDLDRLLEDLLVSMA